MAKKRFTFADAKIKIKELEADLKEALDKVDDSVLNTDDNIYTAEENKLIKTYKYGFWILAAVNAALLISLLF